MTRKIKPGKYAALAALTTAATLAMAGAAMAQEEPDTIIRSAHQPVKATTITRAPEAVPLSAASAIPPALKVQKCGLEVGQTSHATNVRNVGGGTISVGVIKKRTITPRPGC